MRDDHHAFVSLFPFFLFDGLAHIGHGFCRVAGIEARRIELVTVPFAVRQTFLGDELAFAFDEQAVYLGERSSGQRGAAVGIGMLQRFAVLRSAACHRIRGVFKRREILVGRNFFLFRRNVGFLGVGRRGENAFIDFAVALADFVLHFFREVLEFADVGLDRFGKVAKLKR